MRNWLVLYLYEQVMEAVPFIRGVTVSGWRTHSFIPKKNHATFKALRSQGLTCYLIVVAF